MTIGVRIVRLARHLHPLEALAAVLARHHADDAVGDDDAIGPRRMDENAMDVALLRIGIDRQLGEALAEVLRYLQRADLDADPQPVAVEHDVLDMADARRRREGPLLDRLGVAERLQLAPGLALVLADIEMRRQRAGEHHVAALKLAGAARPELVMRQPLVDPGPFEAAVVAARHADAARRGEQRAVVERGHAADEHALHRAVLDGPAPLGLGQQGDAVHRANQDRVGGRLRPLDVGAAVGQARSSLRPHCWIATAAA